MDFIKNAVNKASGGNQGGNTNNNNASGSNNAGKEDYGDKAFDFINKKAGLNMDRNTGEKITDGGREAFEKYTGKDIPDKYSN